VVAFGLGAASLHLVLFALAAAHLVSLTSLAALAAASILPLLWLRPKRYEEPAAEPLDPITRIAALVIFAVYFVIYAVHALAPEIQPDALSYHLGLPAQYLRTGGFSDRVAFYEMLPQGVDLLFLWAFAFGKHGAPKLVHFAFLLATVPLLFAVVRRLGWPDRAAAGTAVLYGCAPITGVSATSAYTDAAMVFYVLAAFYLMLARRHFAAGVAGGFCYAVKISGLLVPLAAWVWAVLRRRGAVAVAAGAAVMIAPWMLRNWIVAQNPVAPLFNAWFPNPYFTASMESDLARVWRTYAGFTWAGAPWDLAVRGGFQGILGPVLLLLPAGLLALRTKAGRLVWAAAAVAGAPWFFNVGARFLLPAMALAALAFCFVARRWMLWPAMAAHAILSLPFVVPAYAPEGVWRLVGFPWRAALGLEDAAAYLAAREDYHIARLIEGSSEPGARIFALFTVPRAYVTRDTLEFWHSREAATLADTLRVAAFNRRDPLYDWGAEFARQPATGFRFRLAAGHAGEWCIHEVRMSSDADAVYPSPQWHSASGLVFDGNLATRWRTWEPMRSGMVFEVLFDRPQVLTKLSMLSHTPVYNVPAELWLRDSAGSWHKTADARAAALAPVDLRRDAARALKAAGFDYILAPLEHQGMAALGQALVKDQRAWGIEVTWQAGWACLLRIR
jgi:hypothetical protein